MDQADNHAIRLSDVSSTMLLTLFSRAHETLSPRPLIVDRQAVALRDRLRPLLAQSDSKLQQRLAQDKLPSMLVTTMALRARHYDRTARAFLETHPDGVIVNLGCGLDTRFHRLDDGRLLLFDLDLPDVIALKRQLLAESERYRFIASSVLDFAWMDELATWRERPFLFLAEGLFMYLPPDGVKALVLRLQERFPGCELLCEVFNGRWLEGWRRKVVSRRLQRGLDIGADAVFQFGISESEAFEQWRDGIQFLDDWSYFDAEDPQLGWMRWLGRWDLFRKMQWSVHYRLNASRSAATHP